MAKKTTKSAPAKQVGFIRQYKIQLLLITLLVFIVYARTIQFSYTTLDDETLITNNYQFINDLGNIKAAFLHDVFYNPTAPGGSGFYYRPLMTLSLMLDSQFGGDSPEFYHFINVLLHLVACLLLFRFFILLRYKTETAFFGTVLFTVHPLLSQAVAWIPGRNDSMLTVFALAGFIYFIRFLETGKVQKLLWHVLFFALALFTKETAVIVPLLVVLYFILLYAPKNPQAKTNLLQTQTVMLLLAGYLLVLLSWFLLRHQVVSHTIADVSFKNLSHAFISNSPTWLQVVQKTVAPYNLSILSVAKDTNYILSVIVIAVLVTLLALSKQKRWQYIVFGFVWFNAFLLPSFLVPLLSGFEQRAYLPMVGFLIMTFEIDYFKNLTFSKPKSYAIVAAVILVFIVINFKHTGAFADNFVFWENAASNSPHSSLAKLNYGKVLADQGRTEEAIAAYDSGLAINPTEPMIHNNIGVIYAERKDYADAAREFKKETEIDSTYSDAFYNLGITYKHLGNDSGMLAALNKAIALNPNHQAAKNVLNKYYQSKLLQMK